MKTSFKLGGIALTVIIVGVSFGNISPPKPESGEQEIVKLTPRKLPKIEKTDDPTTEPAEAPPEPEPGEQEIVKIDEAYSCVSEVETNVQSWAQSNGLAIRVPVKTVNAIDIELIPDTFIAQINKQSSTMAQEFESQCMLFYDSYSNNPAMLENLRAYLTEIQLTPNLINEKSLIKKGFTIDDANHLREHLMQFIEENQQISTDIRYRGIRYLRVTYSIRPNSEFTVNIGTLEKYKITNQQRKLINSLKGVVSKSTQCNNLFYRLNKN
jgi:hypothetical protein